MMITDNIPLKCYRVECQKFPGNDAIQITLTPQDVNDSCYNIDCVDEDTAFKVLDMLGFPADSPEKNITQPDIENFIDFVLDFSEQGSDIEIVESIKVNSPLLINNKIIENGVITFFHKGRI